MKKKPIFPAWYNKYPAWEKEEIKAHYEPETETVTSPFISATLSPEELFNRRLEGEPLEYILGHCHVDQLTLKIDSRALIPRPETETLVRRFVDHARALPPGPVVDCGTGSGFIAGWLAENLERRVIATDLELDALELAAENKSMHGWAVDLVAANLLAGLELELAGIVANLPYVEDSENLTPAVAAYEPKTALFPREQPVEFYRRFLHQAYDRLKPGGELRLEGTEALFQPLVEELDKTYPDSQYDLREDNFDRIRFLIFRK